MVESYKEININEINNNLLKDYIKAKNENPDSIILFQIGDFFETFFEDSKVFSENTGTCLSTRTIKEIGEIPQAGIPIHSLNFYIKKLLNSNLKICICEQFKNIKTGQYERIVTRKITKGTIIEKEFLDTFENNFILSILKLDHNSYDICYADVSTGQFYKTNGSYKGIKEEIDKISPNEVLILDSQKGNFKDIISNYETTILDKKYEVSADEIIKKYIKETQKNFVVKLDKTIEYKIENYLLMDSVTRKCLELTRTRRQNKKKGSLMWFLNYTKTPMGARLLKKYLNEPLLDIEKIKERQQAIEEIITNKNLIKSFDKTLDCFSDISRICAKISNSTIFPKDLFQIAHESKRIEKLYELTKKFNSKLIKLDERWLNETYVIANRIKEAISKDAPNEIKSGGIINSGYNTELDYLNQKLNNAKKEILKLEKSQQKKLEIEKLKIDYSSTIGYYIEIPKAKQTAVPNTYLRKQVLNNCLRYTIQELKDIEEEILSLRYKINDLEYKLYTEIRKMAASFVEKIRKLANDIANIDVLVSFAKCAIENGLNKPEFNAEEINIQEGFHPSLIKLKNEIIKNPTIFKNNSVMIITGANMSGKSTYLKHNAIISLLAQIGSYVPCKKADLVLIDKIFFRQGSTDDIINNNSTFMVEMNDLKCILDNSTKNSLIFLDEPAKSTNEKEGGAIARAYVEYIIENKKTKTMIVTHNFDLTSLEEKYPNIVHNYTIGSIDETKNIIDRKLKKGIANSSKAINTALLADLPEEIIKNAKDYLKNH